MFGTLCVPLACIEPGMRCVSNVWQQSRADGSHILIPALAAHTWNGAGGWKIRLSFHCFGMGRDSC